MVVDGDRANGQQALVRPTRSGLWGIEWGWWRDRKIERGSIVELEEDIWRPKIRRRALTTCPHQSGGRTLGVIADEEDATARQSLCLVRMSQMGEETTCVIVVVDRGGGSHEHNIHHTREGTEGYGCGWRRVAVLEETKEEGSDGGG